MSVTVARSASAGEDGRSVHCVRARPMERKTKTFEDVLMISPLAGKPHLIRTVSYITNFVNVIEHLG